MPPSPGERPSLEGGVDGIGNPQARQGCSAGPLLRHPGGSGGRGSAPNGMRWDALSALRQGSGTLWSATMQVSLNHRGRLRCWV
ncbi:hypothetical protein AZA_15458 [Nitrospirillum viridazoti Y2]|nr:hypothetical protein AZA_15458 [Nitrospirillum amazonense Y2]